MEFNTSALWDINECDEPDTSDDELLDDNDKEYIGSVNAFGHKSKTCGPYFEMFQAWKRPEAPQEVYCSQPMPGAAHKFKFYLMDCDSWASKEVNPLNASCSPPGSQLQPVMRLFGVNEVGSSVTCFVHGFSPYFYALPSNKFTENDLSIFKDSLNEAMLREINEDPSLKQYVNQHNPPIVNVQLLEDASTLNIFEFHKPRSGNARGAIVILKVSTLLTKFVWLAAKVLNKDLISCPVIDNKPCCYQLFEVALNTTMRFLTSLNISCCSWLDFTLTPGTWYDRGSNLDPALGRQTYSQIEFDIEYKGITVTSNSKPVPSKTVPKLRVLSFDIECMTRPPDYEMPQNGNDQVLQIGNVLSTYNAVCGQDQPVKVIFTLGTCDSLPDATVISFQDEQSLLEAWRLFVITTDPDIITGYNIHKFDIPFLIERARNLGVKLFPYFSRIIRSPASYRSFENSLKQINRDADRISCIPGRVVFDMYPVIRQNFPNEQNFKLENISRVFLGEEKLDVKFKDICELYNQGPTTRGKLAKYCLQDAWISLQLVYKNPRANEPTGDFITYYCEKSSSSGSPLRYLLSKSKDYITHFRTVRKHKNPEVQFALVTPASRKREATGQSSAPKRR